MRVDFQQINWPFASTFRIAYRVQTEAETVLVTLNDGEHTGRGEGLQVVYHGETIESMLAQLNHIKGDLVRGITRADLTGLLPPGGARNAVDCALWDLEAKRAGRRAWELAGLESVRTLKTAYTLSLDSPAAMGRAASNARGYTLLKLKLTGDGDYERVAAVRQARSDVDIIVDANQSWSEQQLHTLPAKLAELGVKLIEQPVAVTSDALLSEYHGPIPLCADESCQTTDSVSSLLGRYEYVNIKLDKTGGLTEALELARIAKAANLKLMVGCMAGSSLSMAPAFVVGQLCSFVDLDGPLLSASDVPHGIRYEGSSMFPPDSALWG